MKWTNLKDNKCPNCDKDWAFDLTEEPMGSVKMLVHGCGFRISQGRYQEIVSDRVMKGFEEEAK